MTPVPSGGCSSAVLSVDSTRRCWPSFTPALAGWREINQSLVHLIGLILDGVVVQNGLDHCHFPGCCSGVFVVLIGWQSGLGCFTTTHLQLVHMDHLTRTVACLLHSHVCGRDHTYNQQWTNIHVRSLGRTPIVLPRIEVPHPLPGMELALQNLTIINVLPSFCLHIQALPGNTIDFPIYLLFISDKLVGTCPKLFFACRRPKDNVYRRSSFSAQHHGIWYEPPSLRASMPCT